MKVLFDHNLPHKLRTALAKLGSHDVATAAYLGWAELKNGALLRAAEASGFEVLITGDRTLVHEQNFAGRRLGVIPVSTNIWPMIQAKIPQILTAIEHAAPGTFQAIDCGTFSRKRNR